MKRFSFDLVAVGVVFQADIIVPLIVTTVLAQSSGDDSATGDNAVPKCFIFPDGTEYCPPTPTPFVPPTATPYIPPNCITHPWECDRPDPTATPRPTATPVPPTNTPIPPTNTPVPPTNTPVPPTNTPIPPTNTPIPPTNTPIPPTNTPIPPTNTPVPPTNTPIPPTNTPIPPTNTPVPPTNTPVPPTNTPVPPTNTPRPTATAVPLDAPVLTATAGVRSATLTWTRVAAAEEYLVQDLHYECGGRSGQRCADPVSFQTLSRVTGHDATLLNLVPRRSYSFRVCSSRVQGGTEETACSSVETVIILDDPTPTPKPTATPGAHADT